MIKTLIFIITLAIIISGTTVYAGDLLEQYMSQQTNMNRTDISYGFGVSMPPLYPQGSGGNAINLSAGLSKGGSCGKFSLTGELQALINSKIITEYLQDVARGIISGAPMLLTCYASQTLCDLMKFVKNMANFAMQLRAKQCQQIEQLAADTGTMLRNQAMKDCVYNKLNDGSSLNDAMESCKNEEKINMPGTGQTGQQQYEYNLVESLQKKINDPVVSGLAGEILGDVKFSARYGIQTTSYKQYAEENLMTELQHRYRNALVDIINNSANKIDYASDNDLKAVSIPGFPITRQLISNLNSVDAVTRENFIDSYVTVASLNALLMKLRTLVDALEMEKGASTDKARIERLEEDIKKVERKYDLLYKNLDIQARYLSPMMQALNGYTIQYRPPTTTQGEVDAWLPPKRASQQ